MSYPLTPARIGCNDSWIIGLVLSVVCALCATAVKGADEEPEPISYQKLAKMSLEELMATEVTSVAGVAQEWFKTPAAMYVITNEDVQRTGHRSVAEALRLSPGLSVLHADSNTWNIGARGNSGFTNKLQVLTDGRTTYDLLFSGTFWDVQDVLLEDLDRIEVIRGPGATLWGANAVNGVINITTRSAKDTQGLYVGGGAGIGERGFGEARYGFAIGDDSWMRVWGKWADYDAFEVPGPGDGRDEWDMARGGLRYDREGDDHTFLMVQAEAYGSDRIGELLNVGSGIPYEGRAEGGHGLFRFGQEVPHGDGWSVQGYYDRTALVAAGGFEVDRDTFDLDFRHHFKWGEINETVWGVGYRYTTDRTQSVTNPAFFLALDPRDRTLSTASAFVQDTITFIPDTLFGMIGSKFEHNDFTGFEFQPSGRVWWTPDDTQTLWAAISRPVRTPTRLEDDIAITLPFINFTGNTGTEAEELIAYELGYRRRLTTDVTLDAALFYNDYDNLVSVETVSPPGVFPTVLTFDNRGRAQSYGAELAATWRVAPNWTLHGSYSVIEVNEEHAASGNPEGGTPQNQAQLRSTLDITKDLGFNAALYYVDNIPRIDVDHFLRLDVGLTWRVSKNLDIAVWGQNLLDDSHRESSGPAEVERGGYLMARVRF